MKKIILLCAAMLSATATFAQSLIIELKDGQSVEYQLNDINQLTFRTDEGDDPDVPVDKIAKFTVPASFADSYVYKVMLNGAQVAEVAKEYIKSIDQQVVVVYPMGEDGKADLTKGICATNGASVVWDLSKNTATVGEAAEAVSTFYIVEGELATSYDGDDMVDATLEADVLVDKRATETNTYRIVKIGVQYWTADNLRTIYYTDGTPIQSYTEEESVAWNATTEGAYLAGMEKDWVKMAGLYYNGYVATSDKIAPEGWAVPTQPEYSKLRSAGNNKAANFRETTAGAWGVDVISNNMTGFSAIATGSFAGSNGIQAMNTDAYFWTSTSYYDILSRANNLDTFRVSSSNTGNTVLSSSALGGHVYNFGHTIRFVRR